jgi:nucleoside-diphosphate-sugar epimerase
VDALICCATHPSAVGQTYLLSDGSEISTAQLCREIAIALACGDRTFYLPPALLRGLLGLLGKSAQLDRLFGSLRIDSSKIQRELAWSPPYTMQQGLRSTADWYRAQRQQ